MPGSPTSRVLHWAVAASTFAGFAGAGAVDALWIVARGGARPGEALALGLGLYGVAGLVVGAVLGWVAATALGAIPGGVQALRDDGPTDGRVAGALIAGLAGAVVMAMGTALAQGLFVGAMASRTLAVIATAGLTLMLAPLAVVAALACRRPAARLAARLPLVPAIGRTGLLLALLGAGAVLAAALALSRADWRVLDLGPLKAAALAAILATLHGLFYYVSPAGSRLQARLPLRPMRWTAAVLPLAALLVAASVPQTSPTFQAISEDALGLRLGLRMARAASDRDGDGFSARFGGGDCDDARADTFPGAEDTAGDGMDQNCEGGDARAAAPATVGGAATSLPATRAAAGAFTGNVLIVSIDSLRADRLGVAGYGRPTGRSLTPTLDALARRGAYFRRVWAQAPNTPRSFPSIVTARYPSDIAWQQRAANYSAILPSNETFFEALAAGGWKPLGIFSHFYFTADRGISQGFGEWSNDGAGTIAESNRDVASPRIVPKVIARIQRAAAANERFVLWTHLFEPHSSYLEHTQFPTKEKGVAGLEEKYDYEIAFVDGWVGKILAALDATGLGATTAVVVLADHGEAWGEHKRYFHGTDLSEEQLRVPLIFAVPGRAPVIVDDEVALVDVGPTILDLVGLPVHPGARGRSLLPRIDGKPLAPRPVFAELLPASSWNKHEVMMVDGGRKLTHRITDRRYELHDLREDPRQQRNLAEQPAQEVLLETLKAKLLAFQEGQR